jgi:cobalamin-dependent methionine synthase I
MIGMRVSGRVGEDVVVYEDASRSAEKARFCMLRQQAEKDTKSEVRTQFHMRIHI